MSAPRIFWKLLTATAGLNFVAAVVVGIVLSVALQEEVAEPTVMRRWVWSLIFGETAFVFALSYVLIRRIVRPIGALNRAATKLAAGDYEHRVYMLNRDELGTLAGTLNRVSESLGHRMTQLSQTAARQSTVLGGMIEGVIAVDARERIVLANAAAGRMYGFRPVEAEGRPLLEVIRNHALHAAVATSLETGEPQRFESLRLPTKKCDVDIHVQPLPGEPCPGVVLVFHDTTELRRLEAIRRDFMANVSHELKTPLSSIKAYAETLRSGDTDPEITTRFLGRIEEQADRLNSLILDMLMLARIESAHQSFEIAPVDVTEVVQACIEAQRPAAESKHIQLAIDRNGSADCRPRVRADREALREIVDNLVDNAIKYTPDGGRVTVSWTREELGARSEERGTRSKNPRPNKEQPPSSMPVSFPVRSPQPPARASAINSQASILHLSISDTGIGIKPQDQDRIFERFYRVDKARSRELGGTGLGLSIVKHLAQALGGEISVASAPGQGSTFTVKLPLDGVASNDQS